MARKRPSASSASSPVSESARPWFSDRNSSERVATHFTGRPSYLRGEHQRDRLGVDAAAHAEAAADVARDDAEFFRRQAGDLRELAAHAVDALARRIHGDDAARRVAVGDAGARLDRAADQTLAVHGHAAGERRACERGLNQPRIARLVFEGEIARRLGVYLGCAGAGRVVKAHGRRQVLVVGRNVLGGILRQQCALGHDQRQGLADIVHMGARERRPERFLHLLSADTVVSDTAGERLEAGGVQIGGGQYHVHARARARRLRVDAEDFRVRAIGAHEAGVELARKIPVGGVAALAGQQAFVFTADGFFSHAAVSLRKIGRSVSGGRAGT